MENLLEWVIKNKEWLFSGIGVTAIGLLFSRRRSLLRGQSVNKSFNVTQIGGDVTIGAVDDRTKR